jgi:plasmid stabilization system protein ParE
MRNADWSEVAREDLKEIGRYIGRTQYRPSIAAKVMREIRNHCDFLSQSHDLGTARPDLGDDIRVTNWKRWVIVFRPATNGIDVLRVVDGSRDWAKLF